MKGRKILKRLVVSFSEAAEIGKVENIYFDRQARMATLLIKSRERQQEGLMATEIGNVHALGRDAITIEDSRVVETGDSLAALEAFPNLRQLVGCRVITEGGIFLGMVRDLVLDAEDRRITDFELSGRGVLGRLRGDTIPATGHLRFGKDLVIVPNTVALKGHAVIEQIAESPPAIARLASSNQDPVQIPEGVQTPTAVPAVGQHLDAHDEGLTRAVGG